MLDTPPDLDGQRSATAPADPSVPSSAPDAKPAAEPDCYRVSVRSLAEFTGRRGDLDRRFSVSPSARQGIAAHQRVARQRAPGHEIEVPLEFRQGPVWVVGRADIFDPQARELEEVKTCLGPPGHRTGVNRSAHWAQLRLYGAMICATRSMEKIRLTLVYFDLLGETEYRDSADCEAEALMAELRAQCHAFERWARQELAHRRDRDRFLAGLAWPHAGYRSGQRALAVAAYKALIHRCLLRAQAPTGIGKTMGILFPALRAMPEAATDRIFYLTAKGTGRKSALDALNLLVDTAEPQAAPIRVIELVSRERSCEHPDRECHGESCPLARGFHDRLPAARQEAVGHSLLDQSTLRSIGLGHGICPYYLAHEVLPYCDVVVGDYNYWFDRHALLAGLTQEHEWRVALLIDEAHQLADRCRGMYSARLTQADFVKERSSGPRTDRIIDQWDLLKSEQGDRVALEPVCLTEPPEPLLKALGRFIRRVSQHLEEGHPLSPFALERYFRCLSFAALAEQFGPHSLCELGNDREGLTGQLALELRNVVPAPFVRERLDSAQAALMFSGTLHPEAFDHAMLGWTRSHRSIELGSPFDPTRLKVRTIPISTRLEDRARTARAIARVIARQFIREPGCYVAFFSSFDYLDSIAAELRAIGSNIMLRPQRRSMTEAERMEFISGFDPATPSIALAVLGGVFAEGMDLPGARLIGAFIVTLGLPQVNAFNNAVSERLDELFGRGFDFTYLYPGLCKVIQAAGRVIRDVEDRGTVMLIDERWSKARLRALLPEHWGLRPESPEPAADRSPPQPPARPSA
jgi:Rad3-related DNA helicase